MPLIDILLPEYDRETETTRQVLVRVPEKLFSWKPHSRLMTLGALSTHITKLPTWTANIMESDSFDIKNKEINHAVYYKSASELLNTFDVNVASAREILLNRVDGEFNKLWTLKNGARDIFTLPRIAMLRYFVLNHLIHHRGQLSVYLRLNEATLPPIYGPSTDEGFF